MSLIDFRMRGDVAPEKPIPIFEFFSAWKNERAFNRNAFGKLVDAVGVPVIIDTSKDERLGRIFSNRTIYRYPAFDRLYGIEDPIRSIMRFFEHGAEGLEQSRQILYLLGPVGSGKSTIVETLKRKFEDAAVYVLAVPGNEGGKPVLSPVFENPLGLFDAELHGKQVEDRFQIPRSRLCVPMSRWANDQWKKLGGDMSKFLVVKLTPSMVTRECVARVEPGSGHSADVGTLIGRATTMTDGDISSAYEYSGGLNRTTQGVLEIFEMFKAPEQLLYPLIGATQEHKYSGAGSIGELPCETVFLAHSNEAEWLAFKKSKKDEEKSKKDTEVAVSRHDALIDRIYPVHVPYCVRLTEEAKLYQQYLANSELCNAPCVPRTLELLARFAIATRVHSADRDKRIRIYDGQSIGQKEKSADDFRKEANWREGMNGISTRFLFKKLPEIAEANPAAVGLDPVTLLDGLQKIVVREGIPDFSGRSAAHILEQDIAPACKEVVTRLMQHASFEDFESHAVAKFDQYIAIVDAYCEDELYKDRETGEVWSLERVDEALCKLERGMNVVSPKDFRYEMLKTFLRHKADMSKQGIPAWHAMQESLKVAFERNIMPTKEELLPLINYNKRKEVKEQEKHDAFVARLMKRARCSALQARLMVEWYMEKGS